jgi:hypothetical protein
MKNENKELAVKWFRHIAQMATDRKTANGKEMDFQSTLDEIKCIAKEAMEYLANRDEYENLLLKDICARLPYRLKFNTPLGTRTLIRIEADDTDGTLLDFGTDGTLPEQWYLGEVRPYLRSMNSMSDEEAEEMFRIIYKDCISVSEIRIFGDHVNAVIEDLVYDPQTKFVWFDNPILPTEAFDWLNKHHFDHRGLIEKGLALKATEGMYNI